MAHKDWGSDDFLNDFLDFDYGKPVPKAKDERVESKNVNGSKGLPADKNQNRKQDDKKYGLSDESFKEYQRMRQGENGNAGQQAQKSSSGLRPSGAFGTDIPEPLSKINAGKSFGFQSSADPAPSPWRSGNDFPAFSPWPCVRSAPWTRESPAPDPSPGAAPPKRAAAPPPPAYRRRRGRCR